MSKFFFVLILFFFLFFSGCINKPVDNSLKQCIVNDADLGQILDYGCVLEKALENNDITICEELEYSLSDPCVQDFYIEKKNPAICEQIKQSGIKENCQHYYLVMQKCETKQVECVAGIAIDKNRQDICNILTYPDSYLEENSKESEEQFKECENIYEKGKT